MDEYNSEGMYNDVQAWRGVAWCVVACGRQVVTGMN